MTIAKPMLCTWLVAFCVLDATAGLGQTLRIYHIDVEQADSALVVMPNGKTLLIDSGKNGHGSRIKAAMDLAGVTQIDAFVNSHYHEDHFGGIDDLVTVTGKVFQVATGTLTIGLVSNAQGVPEGSEMTCLTRNQS